MKYIQAILALLALQLGSTMARSSSRRRLSLTATLDTPESGAFAYGEYNTLEGAVRSAGKKQKSYSKKAEKKAKKSKDMSKGYFGKDCPMKAKSAKSAAPTQANPDSEQPSAAPSTSHQPSWAWCQESDEPTADMDGTNEVEEVDDVEDVARSAVCENRGAAYDGNEIIIYGAGDTRADEQAVAALATDVASPVDSSETRKYNIDVLIQIKDGALDTIGSQMDATVSPPTTLVVVDCNDKAQQVALEHFKANTRRELQEGPDGTLVVMQNWECTDASGCSPAAGNSCATCATSINYIGTLEDEEFESRLQVALLDFLQMMDNVAPELYPQQTINKNDISVEKIDSNVNGVIDSDLSQKGSGIRAGPFIGAATGMLAVLLLLILFVRRRNRFDEQVSHLKLDDDDTYYPGSEGTGVEHEYNTRDIHIVGEGDSVISHWTGFTGKSEQLNDSYGRDGLMRGRSTDVHQCSSATCEICDKQRQAGVHFVKTHSPSVPSRIHSLPSDASRDYIAEDTVQL